MAYPDVTSCFSAGMFSQESIPPASQIQGHKIEMFNDLHQPHKCCICIDGILVREIHNFGLTKITKTFCLSPEGVFHFDATLSDMKKIKLYHTVFQTTVEYLIDLSPQVFTHEKFYTIKLVDMISYF